MQPETIKLEKLRQEIESAEKEAGSQSDYIDRGRPSAQQAKQAQQYITQLQEKSAVLKSQLHEHLEFARKENPQIVREWVDAHKAMLQKILGEPESDRMHGVRIHVARQTLEAWEKVQNGEQDYVGINDYYLKDYAQNAKKLAQGDKNWWPFWKK
jgi:hypothetical protein